MSRHAPSLIGLLGQLQRHGLTYAHLAAFVAACGASHTGPVTFQLTQGRIRLVQVEERSTRRPPLRHD